jgi:hypothetical protein
MKGLKKAISGIGTFWTILWGLDIISLLGEA